MLRTRFVIQKIVYDLTSELKDHERLIIYDAILKYGFLNEDVLIDDHFLNNIFIDIKFRLDEVNYGWTRKL